MEHGGADVNSAVLVVRDAGTTAIATGTATSPRHDCRPDEALRPEEEGDQEHHQEEEDVGMGEISERTGLVQRTDASGYGHAAELYPSPLSPKPSAVAPPPPRVHSTFEWTLGVIFILIVALIWTFASVLVQYIFHELSFQGPFFLTYVGITLFSVNLPLWYLSQVVFPRARAWLRGETWQGTADGALTHHALLTKAAGRVGFRAIFKISAIVSPLWFIANFTYNQSLNMTSVTSSTIVSSTSTVFTFLLSVCVLREPFVWLKLVGVVLCMLGNITTVFNDYGLQDTASAQDHVVGDLVALFAAFMYGVYITAIRRLIPDEESVSISLFFGFLGVINFVCLLPFVITLHYTGIESLSGLSLEILVLIGCKGLFDNVLSDYLWARAVLLTSPTVATVGLSLTVPFAIISDYVFHQAVPSAITMLASTLVISGFVFINVSTKNNRHDYHPTPPPPSLESKKAARESV